MAELEKIIWISIILIVIISVKEKLRLALPILLLVTGLILSLTRLVPSIDMSPEMIFYVVLPPILFDAAWNTSIPEFKKRAFKDIPSSSGAGIFDYNHYCMYCTQHDPRIFMAFGIYIRGHYLTSGCCSGNQYYQRTSAS